MALWNRSDTLSEAVTDWQARGLIDSATADRLAADIADRRSAFSFANILVLLAIILIGFAAITFVAANWEDMSRLARLILLMLTIWGFWIAAILLRARDHRWFAETCVLGACATFGAAIMLISQMYHIQGSPADAVSYWAFGTLLAAGLARSIPALCLAILLWGLWPWLDWQPFRDAALPRPMFPVWIAVCAALALWMQSRLSAHLIALVTIGWLTLHAIHAMDAENRLTYLVLTMTGFAVISVMLWSNGAGRWLRGFERAGIFYALGFAGPLLLIWHMAARHDQLPDLSGAPVAAALLVTILLICGALMLAAWRQGNPNLYDLCVTAVAALMALAISIATPGALFLSEGLLLALAVWTLRMGWRLSYRPLVVLGFIGFGGLLLIVYFETIGTLLGTAAFYLVAGVTILGGVIAIPRLSRRGTAS